MFSRKEKSASSMLSVMTPPSCPVMTGASSVLFRKRNVRPLSGRAARFTTGSLSAYSVYNRRRFAASMRRQASALAGSERSGITDDSSQERQYAASAPPLTSQLHASPSSALRQRRSPGLSVASFAASGSYASTPPQLTHKLFSKYRVCWQWSQLKSFIPHNLQHRPRRVKT